MTEYLWTAGTQTLKRPSWALRNCDWIFFHNFKTVYSLNSYQLIKKELRDWSIVRIIVNCSHGCCKNSSSALHLIQWVETPLCMRMESTPVYEYIFVCVWQRRRYRMRLYMSKIKSAHDDTFPSLNTVHTFMQYLSAYASSTYWPMTEQPVCPLTSRKKERWMSEQVGEEVGNLSFKGGILVCVRSVFLPSAQVYRQRLYFCP